MTLFFIVVISAVLYSLFFFHSLANAFIQVVILITDFTLVFPIVFDALVYSHGILSALFVIVEVEMVIALLAEVSVHFIDTAVITHVFSLYTDIVSQVVVNLTDQTL